MTHKIASRLTLRVTTDTTTPLLSACNQHTEFQHDEQTLSAAADSLDYKIGWDKRWHWGYLKPSISLRYLDYQLDRPANSDGIATAAQVSPITVPTISFDSGISFEKQSELFSGYDQTLEPRLFYVNSEFREQSHLPDFDTKEITPSYSQLFRENCFVGGDRISDDHCISLGLSTSLINRESGNERFRASIAQAIYFDDRKVFSILAKQFQPFA